ncbi:IS5 family transposase [Flavobacterium oreochromis]|uniref:IS5 family transposase n=1 Tax=Flavobacterium oreochromis TaxID=2906078 RepID=A0ABW8P6V3_9FLAO
MNCSLSKLTKNELENYILPFIPKNKRGFPRSFNALDIFKCIVHKLKTGCQWDCLFLDIESFKVPFSWQTVYYFYRKWCKQGVFEQMFSTYLEIKKDKLDTEKLNLDGTHSLVKKAAESSEYQYRKKGKTSNVLIMTDGRRIPIAIGTILKGNHNDLFCIVPPFSKMVKDLKLKGIYLQNSILNSDKGFDSKKFRRALMRRNVLPNIKENSRNRKTKKREKKRFYNSAIYQKIFVNERCFAWLDSFKTLLIRFDKSDKHWLNWHYLAFALILLKV